MSPCVESCSKPVSHRKGRIAFGLLFGLTFVSVGLRADIHRPLHDRQPLIVGVTADSFPYGFITSEGRWSGYSSDLMDAVARTMHLEIRREAYPSSDSHRRFKAGEFDLLQAFSQTEDRQSFADFSVPYLSLQGAVYISRNG